MSNKSKSKQEEALQILDDLDLLSPGSRAPGVDSAAAAPPPITTNPGEAADVLAFLDEITQKSSEPTRPAPSLVDRPHSRSGTPTLRKSTERVKVGGSSLTGTGSSSVRGVSPSTSSSNLASIEKQPTPEHERRPSGGSWGWGTVWSSASTALQQAKSVVDEQVKSLPTQDTKKWSEGVIGYARNAQERAQEYAKTAQLDKLGQDLKRVGLSTFTEILNVVAPPISEHEVIQVWLSHDMQGYEGVETLVYTALARILEQVEGGDLIVNKGNESKPRVTTSDRDLNAVEGFEQALKLAQANLEEAIRANAPPEDSQQPSSVQNPTTTSYVYLCLQAFTSTSIIPGPDPTESTHLQFILLLSDPVHSLAYTAVTQAIPEHWLKVWDEYDWVEDTVAETLRFGIEVVGQEYVVGRMGWIKGKKPSVTATVEDDVVADS